MAPSIFKVSMLSLSHALNLFCLLLQPSSGEIYLLLRTCVITLAKSLLPLPPIFKVSGAVLHSIVMEVAFPHIHRFWRLGSVKSWGPSVEILRTAVSIHDSWLNDILH